MAIPKSLKPISKDKALSIIKRHQKSGTGEWEGTPMLSDFIYGTDFKLTLIRPNSWGDWETGRVSM